ncbi:hypothetical protein [Methylophaga sp. OBS3]|uniref:hypothetical protein n=1 Tax=Methylophaga sp. OBS3 TaxID=2991934 RepID=UPI00225582EC|nr:hypothetical protein [Methylophaga sp. OBS3]MCX4189834.1 hypothetical protein [Methylophaga sp. OBS3]
MEMLVLACIVTALIYYCYSFLKPAVSVRYSPNRGRLQPYAAVQVRACGNACQAAVQTAKITFLNTQAPTLPLNACDRIGQCECRFQHFADRRHQPDRRLNTISDEVTLDNDARRNRAGRRASDHAKVA